MTQNEVDLLPRDRKVFKDLIDLGGRAAVVNIVQDDIHRHARPRENGHSALALRVDFDARAGGPVDRLLPQILHSHHTALVILVGCLKPETPSHAAQPCHLRYSHSEEEK